MHQSRDLFVCPTQRTPLIWTDEEACFLSQAGKRYPVRSGKTFFVDDVDSVNSKSDSIDDFKGKLKHLFGSFYLPLMHLFSPVMPRFHSFRKTYFSHLVDGYAAQSKIILQIGSGSFRIHPRVVNVDLFPYPNVDVIADGTRLPYPDGSVDFLITQAVLEHVQDPEALLREAYRVLKPNGVVLSGAPFLQGYHASPGDYYRWTKPGLSALHEKIGFQEISVEPNAGPASSLVWILGEFLSLVLSFGSSRFYYVWFWFFTLALWPLKMLDLVLVYHPEAHRISSFFIYVGRK